MKAQSQKQNGGYSTTDLSWAEYLDSFEGVDTVKQSAQIETASSSIWPGLGIAMGLATMASWLSKAPIWPFTNAAGAHPLDAILIAAVMGMLLGNGLSLGRTYKEGITFVSRKLLPFSVVLLGARLDFFELLAVGSRSLVLGCLVVGLTLVFFLVLARWWKFTSIEALLLGIGTAICGGSAIVAVAPVIKAKQAEVAVSVATVTLIGLVAMFLLPIVGVFLGMDARAFGLWVGLVIHQTPQVVAAGFAYGPEAGEVATVVKLARVCLLAPVIVGVSLVWGKWGSGREIGVSKPWWRHIPLFVLGFVGMALLRTVGFLPDIDLSWDQSNVISSTVFSMSLPTVLSKTATFLLVIAMAGVGLETRLAAFRVSSLRACAAAALVFLFLASIVLLLVQ